jgi:hypothetical protein
MEYSELSRNEYREKMDGIKNDFIEYLIQHGFNNSGKGLFAKGYVTIKFISGGRRIVILNNDVRIKHEHIVTCLVPLDVGQADTIFSMCQIERAVSGYEIMKHNKGNV